MSDLRQINAIFIIASNEFKRYFSSPLILVISILLALFAIINGVGCASFLSSIEQVYAGKDIFMYIGICQLLYPSALFCTVVAAFIGAMSMAEERSRKSLDILLTKPVYRRDVILGKFLGLNAFVFIMVTLNLLIISALIAVFFREPLSIDDFLIRITALIIILCLECSLVIGFTMFIGIFFKNILQVAFLAVTFLFIDWYCFPRDLGVISLVSPEMMFFTIYEVNNNSELMDTSVSIASWLNTSAPYILFIIIEIVAIYALNILLFSRSDEL